MEEVDRQPFGEGRPAEGDLFWENTLRPSRFDEFPGQKNIVEKLNIFLPWKLIKATGT